MSSSGPPLRHGIGLCAHVGAALLRSLPPGLSLDLLRSHLSHDVSAKIGRLTGIASEWSQGRDRPADRNEIREIVAELQALYLRYAPLALARAAILRTLFRILTNLDRIARLEASVAEPRAIVAGQGAALQGLTSSLESHARDYVELVSRIHGLRLGELIRDCLSVARRERQELLVTGAIALDTPKMAEETTVWLPRSDGPRWHDLFYNIIRNAIEASAGSISTKQRPTAPTDEAPSTVSVQLWSGTSTGSTVVEVADQGVGIPEAEVDRIWVSGSSRHGRGRGYGLTEMKRSFLLARAALEVRTAPGVGTSFRIEIPPRDILIRSPLRRRYFAGGAAVVVGTTLVIGAALTPGAAMRERRAQRELVAARTAGLSLLRAEDAQGEVIWQKDFRETIVDNEPFLRFADGFHIAEGDGPLLLHSKHGGVDGEVVSTTAAAGPGRLWFIDARGRVRKNHLLGFEGSGGRPPARPVSVWQVTVPGPARDSVMVAAHVRDGGGAPTSVQLFSTQGDSLAAYYHFGHLNFRAAADFDGDGRTEMLLQGINNRAIEDRAYTVVDSLVHYIECVLLLELPEISGQGYPYTIWSSLPPVHEEAYVLFPPLTPETPPYIFRIDIADAATGRELRVDVVLDDGRIYHLDSHLKPVGCSTGDRTLARKLAPVDPAGPVVYIREGRRTDLTIPVPSQAS